MADNFFGATDTGKVRDNNEDAFIAQKLANGTILACVIDGVGGYEGGEVAAAIAKDTIQQALQKVPPDAVAALKDAVRQAAQNIIAEKQKAGANGDMACVLTLALADVQANLFYYAHVGDTRMYLLRDGSLVKVTKDHSFVGFLEDSGRLSEKEAMQHPKRNEINKALGFDAAVQFDEDYIETGSSPFLPGDALLLCSDGLTDLVNNKDMTAALISDSPLNIKAQSLIDAANAAGGKDNITAVLVVNNKKPLKQKATKPVTLLKKNESAEAVTVATTEIEEEEAPVVKSRRNTTVILLLLFFCLLLGAAAWWFWNENKKLKEAAVVVPRSQNGLEKKLADSLGVAQRTALLRDSVFSKNILIGDTLFVRQDSLHIIGNGIVLQKDSTYSGPAFFVTANCKYLLLEGITFKGFKTAVALQGKGLQLKDVIFQDVGTPVQHHLLLPLNDTLSGIVRDSFLVKKDSLPK